MEEKKMFYNLNLNFRRKSLQSVSATDTLKDLIEKKLQMKDVVKQALDGKINSEFRPILWKLFLQVILIDDHENWEMCIQDNKDEYMKKCEQFYTEDFIIYANNYKKSMDLDNLGDNIFSKAYKNLCSIISKEHFEFLNIIKLDVDRTFQEIDLFRNEEIKESLERILFIWSVENKELGYCQGMNEILGTLCYALYPSKMHVSNSSKNDEHHKYEHYIYLLNSEDNFEADLYRIYSEIMRRGFKDLFNYNDIKYRNSYKNGLVDGFELIDKTLLTLEDIKSSNYSALKKRIHKIFYLYLRIYDKQLFLHLYDKVDPYLFLFRWVLCLLNREISLKHIIGVWDSIFAIEYVDNSESTYEDINEYQIKSPDFKENFNFLDFLCVAMICDLKREIIEEDDACFILSQLMHFPNEHNMKEIIKLAIKIRDKVYDHFNISNEFVMIDY